MRIYNGRESFYQWDTNQKLTSDELKIGDILHFFNIKQPKALPLIAYEFEGKVVVNVPNILLQNSYPITVYRWIDDGTSTHTIKKYEFTVKRRPRPNDYIYTETEVLSYKSLNDRLNTLEGDGLADAVANYLTENPVEAGATEEQAKQIEQNKLDIEKLSDEKLSATELNSAIDTALAQAKESGEFDGADGKDGYTPVKGKDYFDGKDGEDGKDATSPVISVSTITGGHRITIKDVNGTKTVDVMDGSDGKDGSDGSDGQDGSDGKDGNGIKSAVLNADYTLTLTFDNGTKYTTPSIRGASGADGNDGSNGKDGQDGYTPVKGVDYFDGKDGQNGQDGKDGTSATHSWNGTTLTVTSASGTSSADLKGEKGNDGYTPVKGKDYFDGQNGADGHTPVKGTDYWTDADKTAIVNDVLSALPTWTGGSY